MTKKLTKINTSKGKMVLTVIAFSSFLIMSFNINTNMDAYASIFEDIRNVDDIGQSVECVIVMVGCDGQGSVGSSGDTIIGSNNGNDDNDTNGGGDERGTLTDSKEVSFIIEVTFIDSSRNGPYDVSIYIQEYPQYSRDNMDLLDAMYDDDPDTPDGQYTTRIVMPSGLIEANEDFHVCMVNENEGRIYDCYEMTNSPQKGPEYLTVYV